MLSGRQLSSIPTSQNNFTEKNLIHKIHLNNGINFANNPKTIDHEIKDNNLQNINKDFNTYRESLYDSSFKKTKKQPYNTFKGPLSQRGSEMMRQGSYYSPRNAVRIFSPKEGQYVYSTVEEENKLLKQSYLSLKSSQNEGQFKIGATKNKQSDYLINPISKFYSPNVETSQLSWAVKHITMPTSNYESANFNIINHSPRQGTSLAKMLKENRNISHRIKGVGEYCDLTRVTAVKPNEEYNNTYKKNPRYFYKANNMCTMECKIGKTYAPLLKSYHH